MKTEGELEGHLLSPSLRIEAAASSLGPARELPWFQEGAAAPPIGLEVEQRQARSLPTFL